MKNLFTIFFILFFADNLISQPRIITGFVFDSTSQKPLVSAHVILSSIDFVDFPHYTTTNEKGLFEFRGIPLGKYSLEITYLGYQKFIDTIQIRWGIIRLDTIYLTPSFVTLKEVTVQDKIVPVEQVGDTLQFNASAFQVAPNSTLEDLVLKFPGVEKEENVIRVQGEEVKKVLVDGRRFFTEDPNIALKTLPADIVEKVQLFDKKSEEAELTGFEDDQTVKAFNVVTRVEKRQGYFGKANLGYGTNTRYTSGLNYNQFNALQRLSLLGISNNINESSFTINDLTQSESFEPRRGQWRQGGRQGGGGPNQNPLNFNINLDDGNNNLYAGGVNYSHRIINKAEINGSYIITHIKNLSDSKIAREYLTDLSNLSKYSESRYSILKNSNHIISIALDYFLDTSNIIRIRPNFELHGNSSSANSFSENFLSNNLLLNSINYLRNNEVRSYSFRNELIYSYRFPRRGRTLTFSLNTRLSQNKSDYEINSEYTTFDINRNPLIDTTIQTSNFLTKSLNLSTTFTYTEPIGDKSLMRIRFTPSLSQDSRIRENFIIDNNNFAFYDSLNSNSFENLNYSYRGSISHQYNGGNFRLETDLMLQLHQRISKQKFPREISFRNTFRVILPSFELSYRISESKNLRVEYNARPNIPSISQLQNTIDFSNPLFLRTGNPDLDKSINNMLRIRYLTNNPSSGTFTAFNLNVNYLIDDIRNNIKVFSKDTVIQDNLIKKGTQLSYPVNAGNSFGTTMNFTYSFKLSSLKSNLIFSSNLGFQINPGFINGRKNITNQYSFSPTVGFSSYNPRFDYRISYSPSCIYTVNSLNENRTKVLTHKINFVTRITYFERYFIGSRVSYYYNPQVAEESNKENILLNLSCGVRILPQNRGEIRFEVYDLLNQKNRIKRIIMEDYIEDRNVHTLQRFFLISFTYDFRTFY